MHTTAKSRLALVGCGSLARTTLFPALRAAGWLPEVLIDPVAQRAERIAQELPSGKRAVVAPDWSCVADEFDVALVAVPNAMHWQVGAGLLQSGKHTLIEPPFSLNSAVCRNMASIAEGAGTILRAARPRRHQNAMRWADAVIRSGILGPVRRVSWRECTLLDAQDMDPAVLRPEEGGVLANPGIHLIDVLSWWLGELEPLQYADDSAGGVESECILSCRAGDAVARLEFSRSRTLSNTCLIEGEKGFLQLGVRENKVADCSPRVRGILFEGLAADALPAQTDVDLYGLVLSEFRREVTEGAMQHHRPADCVPVEFAERCYAMRRRLPSPWTETLPRAGRPAIAPGTRVVVTGATGFIGSRLVERLVEDGAEVRCLIRDVPSAVRLARLPVEFRSASLADPIAVEDALRDTDVVFHCAYDWGDQDANRDIVRNLIDACIANAVGRFVHVSTFSVYDPYPDGRLDENTPGGDRSLAYTRVKLDLEHDVFEAVRTRGLRCTILQPTLVYGPFSKPWTIDPAEMIMFDRVVLPETGDGLCNVLFVDDLVDALVLSATRPEAVGERFLISGPDVVTWAAFYEAFARAMRTRGPEFWPSDTIAKWNSGLRHKLRVARTDPKKLVGAAARVPGVGRILDLAWQALPGRLRTAIVERYTPRSRPIGQLHVPNRGRLQFLMAKPVASISKARSLLGYDARYDFYTGMDLTERWLHWAYPDRFQDQRRNDDQDLESPESNVSGSTRSDERPWAMTSSQTSDVSTTARPQQIFARPES